jgi:hypothetical protein
MLMFSVLLERYSFFSARSRARLSSTLTSCFASCSFSLCRYSRIKLDILEVCSFFR